MSETRTATARNRLDRYELVAEIARGGMGTVYLARMEGVAGFQRLFAIKLMHPHLADDSQFVAMLLDEARIAARIHHPNAVEIIDVCASDRGYYLVMPYVEGFTLERIIEHEKVTPEQRVRLGLRVFCDAAAGLHAAHELQNDDGTPLDLVHRDVSPQNVLVGVDGMGRIADFGVARAAARITSSRPGVIKGKPCYMAPEQARSEELDRRADVFALGTVLWEVLTGQMLFYSEAGDAAMLVRVMNDPVPAPSTKNAAVPESIDRVCLKALERDRDARYQTARDLAVELEEAARDAGLIASAHEVSDELWELFGDEIDARRRAIQDHLNALGRGSVPVVGSDVFDVPKLQREVETRMSKPPKRSGPWHSEVSTADTKLAESGAVSAPREPGRKPWMAVAIGFAVLGLALLAVAYFVGMAREGTTADAEDVRDPSPQGVPATEHEPGPPEAAEAATEVVAPEPAQPAQAVNEAAELVTETVADTVERTEPETRRPRGEAADRPAKRRSGSMRRLVPTLEDNPYLAR